MKFDEFTLEVQLDLYRITNHIILSGQREDVSRNGEYTAAWICHLSKITD